MIERPLAGADGYIERAQGRENMLFGAHVILYSRDAEADRTFLGEVLGFSSVDAEEGG